MPSELSNLGPDITVTDLEAISTTITNALHGDGGGLGSELEAAFNQKGRFLARLLPTQVERARQTVAVNAIKEKAIQHSAMMELYSTTQLEIARKQADALIASVGVDLQVTLAAFAADRFLQLTATLNDTTYRFLDSYESAADRLERFSRRPELYSRATDQLERQLDIHLETVEQLLKGFVAHLQSRITPQAVRTISQR